MLDIFIQIYFLLNEEYVSGLYLLYFAQYDECKTTKAYTFRKEEDKSF